MTLRLRRLRLADELEVRAGEEAMRADEFPFALYLDELGSWPEYLAHLDALRAGAVPQWVRQDLFVAEVDGVLVGRVSLRYELDDFLAHEGGHIGYCVLPVHRGRGYATEMLRHSVELMWADGVDRILITCDDDNVASAAVIERGGGVYESTVDGREGVLKRRYWISR